jgi:acetyl esterase/lipase
MDGTGIFDLVGTCHNFTMAAMVGLLSLSLPFISSVTAAVTPQSVGSDVSIITHNDLYGNATRRNAAAVALSNPSTYATAITRCAALGTTLWNPDGYVQDLDFLRYLTYGNNSDNAGTFWVGGNECRAMTVDGNFKPSPCSTELPALCANTVTEAVRQISVATNGSMITGSQTTQAFRFLGLKYATIPTRFAQSVYLPPASNTTALQYGPTCVQAGCTACAEDCLYLNIWTPYLPSGNVISDKKKAVMVWIHGGGFTSGAGSDTTFDGSALASRGDVVAVTINYRLSTLGFLAVENTTATGNQGLRDQNTALDWLMAHIEDFGGDKNRITIFGQSAGSASVRALLASPQANKKVAGAIMQSTPLGTGDRSGYAKFLTLAEVADRTNAIMNETGCSSMGQDLVTCLSKIDPLKLISSKAVVG